MRSLNGAKLANGDFAQWLQDGRLHVKITYNFQDGHRIVEQAIFRHGHTLIQEEWSWTEIRNTNVERKCDVNFRSGSAHAEKREGKGVKRWSEKIEAEPGRTFVGFGFTLAIENHRQSLLQGEKIKLQAIGFTPKPRKVSVEISYGGVDQMSMSGRTLQGECFVIHPILPHVAKLFLNVPDTRIWLTHPPPAAFLRWEGPLLEPSDPVIRVDLLPGEPSGPATPAPSGKER